MRNRLFPTAVFLLAVNGVAGAQGAAVKDTAPGQWVSLGYRGSSVDGDRGRLERFRDLRDGPTAAAAFTRATATSALKFSAANVGYHDQKYTLDYNQFGKLKVTAMWNSTPLNYAYNTLTPWKTTGGNVWTLSPAARTDVQNKVPGVLGIASTAAQDALASVYRGLATTFPLQSRRDVMSVGMKYRVNDATAVDLAFSSTGKTGNQPYGASFAFNDANELPMAVDNRTNDMTAGLEWAKGTTGMLRIEWAGSWFKNQFQSLTWDNPLRATNYDNGKAPPAGPFDPSGYSNGNGPAVGRLALPPDNSLNTFRMLGLYKMPGHSTLNGQIAITTMKQDDALIPWTTNALIASPSVYAFFPGLASLPRPTAQAEVRGLNALLNYTTRPTDNFALDIRYRFNDHENRTPHFIATSNVRFDAVPELITTETEHFNIRQNTIEAGGTFSLPRNTSFKLGYILDDVKREGRAFSDMTDYTFRASLDTYGNEYLMVRALFERTRRIGNGLSLERIEEGGGQNALRFYDEADMDRNKATVIVQITPNDKMDIGLSLATGKDEYRGEGHEFGLLDNSNSSYNATFTFYPSEKITLGASYGTDKISTMQMARNANPFSGLVPGAYESWNDPNRDWQLDNDETVNNAGVFLDLTKIVRNTDIKFSYDYSKSDNAFVHSGPRIQELLTNTALTTGDTKPCATGTTSCFIPLPPVTNNWTQMKVDLTHMFRPTIGMGLAYWYEKFEVTDFATTNLADGSPRIDPLGKIGTGYGNRPYTGNTTMVRMIIKF